MVHLNLNTSNLPTSNLPAVQGSRVTLNDVGMVIELLMGGAFRSNYCRRKFRSVFIPATMGSSVSHNTGLASHQVPAESSRHVPVVSFALPDILVKSPANELPIDRIIVNEAAEQPPHQPPFKHPFHDLMVWACLLNRQKMALYMWKHGDEAMAKALIASKLFKSMSYEANEDDLEEDICLELSENSKEFQRLAVELLDHCHKQVKV